MGRKYNILQKVETKMKLERGEDENDLITKEMIKEAEEKRKKDTDIFYQKYYKPETSHLAASAREVDDKWYCLSNMFRSKEKIMNSWFMKYFGVSPQEKDGAALEDCLTKLRNPENWKDANGKEIAAPDPHVREMLITYTKVKQYECTKGKDRVDAGKAYSFAGDTTITPEQKKGLEKFQLWLQRNCDKTGLKGIKYGLGKKGPVRNFAEEFMKLPARVQLKALFLLETGKRKSPNEYSDNIESQSYVPSLDKLKDTMIASKFKVFRRLNGSQFYWNKLEEAVGIAKQSEEKLKKLSDDPELKTKLSDEKRLDKIKEIIDQDGIGVMDTDREIEHTGEKWDDTKAMSGYTGKGKSYYGLADNVNKIVRGDKDAVLIPNANIATATIGAVTSAISLAGAVEGVIKSYGTSTKAGVTSKITGAAAATAGAGNASVGVAKLFYDGTTKIALGTASSVIGAGTGAIMMVKSSMDYIREDDNKVQAAMVKLDIPGLKKAVEQEHKTALEEIENSAMRMDEDEKQRKVQAANERYQTNIDNLKLMHKVAQHSMNDAGRKQSTAKRGFASGLMVSGSSTAVLGLAAAGAAGIAVPVALTVGTVAGVAMAVTDARKEDKQQIKQNREYIDGEMYENRKDKEKKLNAAKQSINDGIRMWEEGSDEAKKSRAMYEEAQKKSEVFQDQVRDLYAAKQGYTHQSDAKDNIKGKLFGQVYDAAFKEAPEGETNTEKRIRLNMQELLRSQDLQVHHNEEKRPEKQKEQPTRDKAVASIKKR